MLKLTRHMEGLDPQIHPEKKMPRTFEEASRRIQVRKCFAFSLISRTFSQNQSSFEGVQFVNFFIKLKGADENIKKPCELTSFLF